MFVGAANILHNESFKDSNVHLRLFLQVGKHDSQNLFASYHLGKRHFRHVRVRCPQPLYTIIYFYYLRSERKTITNGD